MYIYAFITLIKGLKSSMRAACYCWGSRCDQSKRRRSNDPRWTSRWVYSHFTVVAASSCFISASLLMLLGWRLYCVGLGLNPVVPPPLKRSPSAAAPHLLNSWADVLFMKFGTAERTSAGASQSYNINLVTLTKVHRADLELVFSTEGRRCFSRRSYLCKRRTPNPESIPLVVLTHFQC